MPLQQLREAPGRVALADARHVDFEAGMRLRDVSRIEQLELVETDDRARRFDGGRWGTAGASPSKPQARTSGRTVGSKQPLLAACTLLARVSKRDELCR